MTNLLDEFRSTHITWDKATSRIYSPVTANESDANGRKLVVQIVNSGQVEDLTGATLHLYWETRDKAHYGLDVFKAVDLKKGEFELPYTTGMLSNQGVLNANLVLIDSVGRVVSERFKITVTEGIDDDAIQSENSFTTLTQALIDIGNLEQDYAPILNDLTAQLQQNARKTNGFIVLSDYCEGSDDDTVGFFEALEIAKAEKKSIYVDGVYTIKDNIVIENKTIPMIFGDSRGVSVLKFDHASGFAIENKSYYSQPFKMKDLIIRQADLSKTLSGVKVKYDGWGGAIDLDNVNIEYFTDVVLDITDGSQSNIKNVMLNGGVYSNKRSATLLQINYTPNLFSNINTFENVTFFNGRIGIQDFGGTLFTFTSCIFESLDLFCHVVNNPLLNHNHKFDTCWFERIERGIINAQMNDDLTPYTPVSDKARVIDLFRFTNSKSGGQIANPFLYEVIEPEYFDNFSVNTGHPIYYFMKPVTLLNGWGGNLEVTKPDNKRVVVQGRLSAGVSATGTEITTLPAGYRPTTASVTAKVVNASRTSVIGDVVIYTKGSVRWVSDTSIVAGDYIDFNISFDIK